MKYKDLVMFGVKELKEHKIDTQLVNYLISYYLHLNEKDKLNNINISLLKKHKFNQAIRRLINQEPIQYIIGSVNFYGYNFNVTPSVLIPRFETEELVNYTIEYIKKYFRSRVSIIDIGTGSGAIGITLKREVRNCNVTLTDISTRALKTAKANAKKLNAEVNIVKGNMLDPFIKKEEKYDIIISNPPYIKEEEEIMSIVKNNEPHLALYGGNDGLKYYKEILSHVSSILSYKSMIAFEIGAGQAKELTKLVKNYFPNSHYEIKKDLQGRNRMLFIFNNLFD